MAYIVVRDQHCAPVAVLLSGVRTNACLLYNFASTPLEPNVTLILNVEDFEAARYAKTRVLQNAGFSVQEATNGAEALEMASRLHPALILLDIRLPDISGLEVCRRIRENAALDSVLVIQTSAAFVSRADAENGISSGADGYLAAPFEPRDLVAMVRTLVQ
jgi:DNA-binding response OmpR family regulator